MSAAQPNTLPKSFVVELREETKKRFRQAKASESEKIGVFMERLKNFLDNYPRC